MTVVRYVVCLAVLACRMQAQQAPSADAQQRALSAVTEFARTYTDRIPNFTCVRITQHLLKSSAKEWRTEAKTAYELSYYSQAEHYKLISVDDIPRTKVPSRSKSDGWIEMSGNFGRILRQLFDPKVHPHFEWHGWDDVHGERAMVFAFRIALAESHAVSSRCGSLLLFSTCKERIYGFHGLLFVGAESFDILRIADTPDDLPADYLQVNASVDYGRVTVAGAEYLLPVADRLEASSGKTLFRNDSTYTDYRKFVSESTLKTGVAEVP